MLDDDARAKAFALSGRRPGRSVLACASDCRGGCWGVGFVFRDFSSFSLIFLPPKYDVVAATVAHGKK